MGEIVDSPPSAPQIAQLVRTHPGLDAYEWHANLAAYGHAGRASSAGEGDESETVVNGLVTSVVIPRLDKLARETYDPLSRLQTARALALVDEVSYCVERSSPRFEVRFAPHMYLLPFNSEPTLISNFLPRRR